MPEARARATQSSRKAAAAVLSGCDPDLPQVFLQVIGQGQGLIELQGFCQPFGFLAVWDRGFPGFSEAASGCP